MDALYSWTLLLALVSGGLGALVGGLALWQAASGRALSPITRAVPFLAALGGVGLLVSVTVHKPWGLDHRAWNRWAWRPSWRSTRAS